MLRDATLALPHAKFVRCSSENHAVMLDQIADLALFQAARAANLQCLRQAILDQSHTIVMDDNNLFLENLEEYAHQVKLAVNELSNRLRRANFGSHAPVQRPQYRVEVIEIDTPSSQIMQQMLDRSERRSWLPVNIAEQMYKAFEPYAGAMVLKPNFQHQQTAPRHIAMLHAHDSDSESSHESASSNSHSQSM